MHSNGFRFPHKYSFRLRIVSSGEESRFTRTSSVWLGSIDLQGLLEIEYSLLFEVKFLGFIFPRRNNIFRAIRQNPHTSIKDMSLQTRIHPTDIINQLMHDRLLVYKHGVYYIKAAVGVIVLENVYLNRFCITKCSNE